MKKIKLMTDYFSFPLWHVDDIKVGDIDPDVLPISESLKKKLMEWAHCYDNTLNMDDPSTSGFKSYDDQQRFNITGRILYQELKEELNGEFEASYHEQS